MSGSRTLMLAALVAASISSAGADERVSDIHSLVVESGRKANLDVVWEAGDIYDHILIRIDEYSPPLDIKGFGNTIDDIDRILRDRNDMPSPLIACIFPKSNKAVIRNLAQPDCSKPNPTTGEPK